MNVRETWHLDTRRLGRRVLVYDRLDSTNTQAAALAEDRANDGVVILADEQLAGRGQHGRTWQSPPDSGVLMSVLLFPPPALRRPVVLTAWATVSVCETIHRVTGLEARIKWPNDVLLRAKKVCGILIEQSRGTVVGIGLNVNQPAVVFTVAGLTEASSLALCAERAFNRDAVARELIVQLDAEYDRLCLGNGGTLEASWRRRLGLLGKQVRAECHDGTHQGRLLEIGWYGVELDAGQGMPLRIPPELIRHLFEVERLPPGHG